MGSFAWLTIAFTPRATSGFNKPFSREIKTPPMSVTAPETLLKPFDNARFEKALGRAKERVAHRADSTRRLEQFVIKSAGKVQFVKIGEIDWIEAADYYSCLHVGGKSYLLRRSLNELEQELDPAIFCRTHRSAIVRLERVRGLELNRNGEYEAVLEGDARVHLSRRYRKQLQEKLELGPAADKGG
jgi:two-component system LytT family response regulator